jgi:hypothetical protein
VDISCYGFFTRTGKDCLFDIRITHTNDRIFYQNKSPSKVLVDQKKEKKDKYLVTCHELRGKTLSLLFIEPMTWLAKKQER